MAQHTIIENIHRNTEDWFAVKAAVRGKGVDCPDDTPTADVAGKIEDIDSGGIDVEYDVSSFDVRTLTGIYAANKITINIPDEVEAIRGAVFNGNTLIGTVICPDDFLKINAATSSVDSPFYRSGVEAIYLGKSLTLLGNYAIYMPTGALRKIYIPKTLSELGNYAIFTATTPFDIYYEGTQAEWEAITGMPSGGISSATMHYEYSGDLSDFLNE